MADMSPGVGNPNDPALQSTQPDSGGMPPITPDVQAFINGGNSDQVSSTLSSALNDNSKAYKALAGQETAEMNPVQNQLAAKIGQPLPPKPDLHAELMKAPQMQDYTALLQQVQKSRQDWMGPAGILSGLVGAFSRKHTTLAIQAFTSAIKGFRSGQGDAVKEQMEIFKQSSAQAVENAKMLQQQYEDVLQNHTKSVDEMMSELNAISLKYHDPLMVQATDARDLIAVQKQLDSRAKTADSLSAQTEKLAAEVTQIPYRQKDAILTAARQSPDPVLAAAGNTASQVLKYKEPMPSGSYRNPQSMATINLVNKISDTTGIPYDAARYDAYKASLVKLAQSSVPPDIGKTEQSISKVNHHLDTLQTVTDALSAGDIRKANEIAQKWGKEFGHPEVVSAQTVVTGVSQEFLKVYVSTGGVEDERASAADNISPDSSPAQIKAAIATMRELMDGQAKGIYLIDQTIRSGGDVAALNVPSSYVAYVADKSPTESSSGVPATTGGSAAPDEWGEMKVH